MELQMDLHGQIMNLNPEKRKQNLAIDEAMKSSKSVHEMMVKVYARAFRDAKHAAAEQAAKQKRVADLANESPKCTCFAYPRVESAGCLVHNPPSG